MRSGAAGHAATLAGGSSGGTWQLSPVTIDVLVRVVRARIAFTRRRGPDGERERLEVWTAARRRGGALPRLPLEEGLAVLTETTGSRRLEAVCRGVLAFNRGDADGWIELFDPDVDSSRPSTTSGTATPGCAPTRQSLGELWPRQRLDDVDILAESATALVISAIQHLENTARRLRVAEPLHLVIAFDGGRARRVSGHATAKEAIAAARGH